MVVEEGVTEILDPVPTNVPPHEPEYQFQLAPVPRDPPVTTRVVAVPWQTESCVAPALVAAVEGVFITTVTASQVVVLHCPSARTKYCVDALGVTTIDEPVPTNVPPQVPLYQFHVAAVPSDPPLTVSVVEPPGHTLAGVAVAEAGAVLEVASVTVTETQDVVLQVPTALTK